MSCSIKLKRKVFFGLDTAMNMAGTASSVGMLVQGKQQMAQQEKQMAQERELHEKQMEEQRRQQERQIEADAKQADLNRKHEMKVEELKADTAKNVGTISSNVENNVNSAISPTADNAANTQEGSQTGHSEKPNAFNGKTTFYLNRKVSCKEKAFGVGGLISDIGKVTWNNKGHLLGQVLGGVAMGGASVLVGSAISHNMKKQGIDVNAMRKDVDRQKQLQKEMSDSNAAAIAEHVAENEGSSISGALKSGIKSAPMGLALSSLIEVPNVISYTKNLDTLKARYGKNITKSTEEAQKNCSRTSIILKRKASQKSFGFTAGKIFDPKGFISHPGKSLLGFASHMAMAGGNKTADSVTKQLVEQGKKSGNATTVKVGEWFREHPKTALAASIPVGVGVMKATFDLGDEVTKKAADKINPNWNTYNKWSEMNG